jgi:hypothetical protein
MGVEAVNEGRAFQAKKISMGVQTTAGLKHAIVAASEKNQQTHHDHGYNRVTYRPMERGFKNID